MAPPAVTVKLADLTILSYPVPTFRALKVLLATGVTFGRLIELLVLFPLAVPVELMVRPFTVVAVTELLALVKLKLARFELLPVKELLVRLKIVPEVAVLVRVCPAKVGVAAVLMFWMVFTPPDPLTVKLVELKLATPVVVVVALAAEMTPVAEMEIGAVAATATVPELSGRAIVRLEVGEVKFKVILLDPEVPRTIEVPIYSVRNWWVPSPKSIELFDPGRRLVLIATAARLESAALA